MSKGPSSKPGKIRIVTSIRFREKDFQAIKLAAYNSHRSLSNWIEVACLWALEMDIVDIIPPPKTKK